MKCQEAPNLPARSVIHFAVIVRGFCARKYSRNKPNRCVVAGCSNTPNAEKLLCTIFHFLEIIEVKRKLEGKKWTDFVKLNHVKWTATVSSAVCSCHFAPEEIA